MQMFYQVVLNDKHKKIKFNYRKDSSLQSFAEFLFLLKVTQKRTNTIQLFRKHVRFYFCVSYNVVVNNVFIVRCQGQAWTTTNSRNSKSRPGVKQWLPKDGKLLACYKIEYLDQKIVIYKIIHHDTE